MESEATRITREQAQVLLKADLANLERKVKEGKTLSACERNLLENAIRGQPDAPTVNFAKNMVELAKILNVDRKTIQRDLKLNGCPKRRPDGRYDVNAWRAWRESRKGVDTAEGMTQSELRARQILLQNQKLEFQLAQLRGEFVPVADVEKWVSDMVLAAKKVLYSMPTSLAPQVVGVSVAEAERRIKESIDEALEQLHARPWQDRK